jgi:hypothetical protein
MNKPDNPELFLAPHAQFSSFGKIIFTTLLCTSRF